MSSGGVVVNGKNEELVEGFEKSLDEYGGIDVY